MIDLKRLTEPAYRAGIERKGAEADLIDQVIELNSRHRELQLSVEELRARSNAVSKEIGKASPEERPAKIEAAGAVKAELSAAEEQFGSIDATLQAAALQLPVPAHESVPDGGEDDGSVVATTGDQAAAPPMDHADFGRHLGWVDNELGASVSGSRFAYITRGAVQLEFALVQYALGKLVARGFIPVVPPVLVREQMMVDAGFFPTDQHQVYGMPEDDLYLVGTAEVPLAGMHRGDRIDESMLPLRYCGFSSCFRREAGTYGKDTRGIFRVHQFDKVEMFIWSHPDKSWDEHEMLLEIEREILDELALPYQVVNIAAGDLGSAAAKKYDCEVWLPSEGAYREVTSCSNYLDYSARRLDARVKTEDGSRFAHTLNGTAIPVARMLVFLMEHYQQADGTFTVPEVLRPFCGGVSSFAP
ncbi:MAG: serine--tRNA ligase [Actinomycetota bacterium]